MKIPKSVRIAGVEYKIITVPGLMKENVAAYGHIDYENSRIELSDSFGVEHQKRCRILWHEILHGIREASGLEIEDEERVVEMFARGIYQVLQDNGARLFDLKTNGDERYENSCSEIGPTTAVEIEGIFGGGIKWADADELKEMRETFESVLRDRKSRLSRKKSDADKIDGAEV